MVSKNPGPNMDPNEYGSYCKDIHIKDTEFIETAYMTSGAFLNEVLMKLWVYQPSE